MINLKSTQHGIQLPIPDVHGFIKFGLVGVTTALIYFFVMWFVGAILGIQYTVAVSLAYFVSTLFHFLANRHFTFGAAHGHRKSQIVRYLLMWFINYLITIVIVGLSVETLQLSPYIGVCVSVLFTMCVGYILGRFWVFKLKEETE
jgi:putative flippase GtrA